MSWRALLVALLLLCLPTVVAAAPQATWVQATTDTSLWSGPGAGAVAFGPVAQWDYFRVERWAGTRLYVWDPRSGNYGYIDADTVGPSGPPPAAPQGRARKPGSSGPGTTTVFQPWWVQAFQPAPLWSGPDADAVTEGVAGRWSFFQVLAPQSGQRMHVRDPLTGAETYVDADAVGPAGMPGDADLVPRVWRGVVGAEQANVRAAPSTSAALLGMLTQGAPVAVQAWVAGEEVFPDQPGWAQLGDGAYVYGPLLRRAALKAPPSLPQGGAPFEGRWIDVNLTLQQVTAYEGSQAVYGAATSSGRPGWETPVGVFAIQRRVASETMDSSTLLGMDAARASYRVEHVRWTQYFTRGGAALHENYWRDPALFGIPSSHGCLGLQAADAAWFWDWAAVGTPVVVHP
jgi:hypothetical protein